MNTNDSNMGARGTTRTPTVNRTADYGSMTGEMDVSEQVKKTADQAQHAAKSALEGQKGRAAQGLGSVASAIRQTGEQMRDQDQETAAHYLEKMAGQVERFSHDLRDQNMDQIIKNAENFARRRPELVIGGAVALGFVLARFLKSSTPSDQGYMQSSRSQYGRETYGRYGESMSQTTRGMGTSMGTGTQGEMGTRSTAPTTPRTEPTR